SVCAPLPAGAGADEFRQAVERHWLPAVDAFAPQLILVSAGFDAHREETLAGLRLGSSDYRWVSERIVELAARHAAGRIVSALEGGYALTALGRCALTHLRVLMGLD
ncbi:MAG: deacetylase, partial [Candidatus Sedimenticola endophacoides]